MFGGLKQQSQIKIIFGKITLYLFNMTQQCAVAGLPRETNNGVFDAANANKSCVRVHGGQSSEFPIYPTTRERGISLRSNLPCLLILIRSAYTLSLIRDSEFLCLSDETLKAVGPSYHTYIHTYILFSSCSRLKAC